MKQPVESKQKSFGSYYRRFYEVKTRMNVKEYQIFRYKCCFDFNFVSMALAFEADFCRRCFVQYIKFISPSEKYVINIHHITKGEFIWSINYGKSLVQSNWIPQKAHDNNRKNLTAKRSRKKKLEISKLTNFRFIILSKVSLDRRSRYEEWYLQQSLVILKMKRILDINQRHFFLS